MTFSYDGDYSEEGFYWGLSPNDLVVKSINFLREESNVLDLGCGEGKNSFYLAKQRMNVVAVDISEPGINKLKKHLSNLKIKTEISEAKDFLKNSESFDAIYAINLLQFFSKDQINEIVELIKNKTKTGGYNIIASFIAENPRQKSFLLSKGKYLFDEGELKNMYDDWEISFYEEKFGAWETHGEPKHRHYKVKLIAKKIT